MKVLIFAALFAVAVVADQCSQDCQHNEDCPILQYCSGVKCRTCEKLLKDNRCGKDTDCGVKKVCVNGPYKEEQKKYGLGVCVPK
ncbi:unnamed protein product, partial [Mesorhabditis spiculigera]